MKTETEIFSENSGWILGNDGKEVENVTIINIFTDTDSYISERTFPFLVLCISKAIRGVRIRSPVHTHAEDILGLSLPEMHSLNLWSHT